MRDTTLNRLALEELSDSEQQLRLLVESVRDFAIFALARDGTVKTWNAGAEKVFGYARTDIIGRDYAILFGADDIRAGVPSVELHEATIDGFTNVERWLVRKDGSRFLASGKLSQLERDAAGDLRFVKILHDITALDAASQDVRRHAHYDDVTELPNRRTFYENVLRAIALMKRRPSKLFAVLFVDVDPLEPLSDDSGRVGADERLAVVARRLKSCVRPEDCVARIGGDEFAILLNGISGVADADDAAERIGIGMRRRVDADEQDACATTRIGIAIGSLQYDRPQDILRDAAAARFTAKTDARVRPVFVATPLACGSRVNIDLAADLRHAIERRELRIAYQPMVRLSDTTIVGFEALVRWQHPRRGLLAPVQFIPKAEESDLIVSIDRWMIREACLQLANWQARGIAGAGLHMSVNISSREFSRDDFLRDLRRILKSSGLAATRLRLEITEGAVMERSERADALLAAIRRLGVALDVDDFGTGYSSLGALQHISVDALKIDASFVTSMNSRTGAELIETVITLAHRLGLVAIAEGIETAQQLRRLVALGCDFGQGFLFAPPLDADVAGRFAQGEYAPG